MFSSMRQGPPCLRIDLYINMLISIVIMTDVSVVTCCYGQMVHTSSFPEECVAHTQRWYVSMRLLIY